MSALRKPTMMHRCWPLIAMQATLCACAVTQPALPSVDQTQPTVALPLQHQVQQLGPAGATRFGFCDDDCPRPSPKTIGAPVPAPAAPTAPLPCTPTP